MTASADTGERSRASGSPTRTKRTSPSERSNRRKRRHGSRDPEAGSAFRSPFIAMLAVLALSVFVGGGGSRFALANLAVQLGALLALALNRWAVIRFWREAPFALRALIVASLLVPLAQAVPLPPNIWQALPGRDLAERAFGLAMAPGEAVPWTPLSVDPIRTVVALSALVVPVCILSLGWNVPRDRLIIAGWVVVAMGLAQFAIGIVQVLSNGDSGLLYPQNPMPGVLFGFFANRNSAGLFLVAALAFAVLLPPIRGTERRELPFRIAAAAVLVLAVALTRSRTALVLAALPLALAAWRYIAAGMRSEAGPVRDRARTVLGVGAVAALIVAALLVIQPGRVGDTLDRFEAGGSDPRAYIWEDALFSAERYWPAGSGMGTFDEVFQVDESLENMAQLRAGRAHSDYIEIAIEAGLVGLVMVAVWLALVAWLAWRARGGRGRWVAWSGAAVLAAIALQSITDYPLRNLSMLALAGFSLLILARFCEPGPGSRRASSRAQEDAQ